MKNLIALTTYLIIFLFSSLAWAEKIEDVQILSVTSGKTNIELKLKHKKSTKNFFFLVDITKDDTEAFEKLSHVVKKISLNKKYILNLDIVSFSQDRSGSYYKSADVEFTGQQK